MKAFSLQTLTKYVVGSALILGQLPQSLHANEGFGASAQWFQARNSAQQCAPIDLRDSQPGLGAFFHIPRNQAGTGWCYAHTAADLLTQRLAFPVSAADLAHSYNIEVDKDSFSKWLRKNFKGQNGDDIYNGGSVRNTGNLANTYGICSEFDIPSTFNDAVNLRNFYLDNLRSCAQAVRSGSDDAKTVAAVYETRWKSDDGKIDVTRGCGDIASALFPKMNPADVLAIAAKESNINRLNFELSQRGCSKRYGTGGVTFVEKERAGEGDGSALFGDLDRTLNEQKMVGIRYKVDQFTGTERGFFENLSTFHASVVVGREFRGGECKYLVRNSYGTGCDRYIDEVKKDCIDSEGAFWVSEKRLAEALYGITFVQ